MILTKDQINRYMRHIAMPEISGQGQKKLLDSALVLFAENPAEASLALHYITALGVGNVYCGFNDATGWEKLSRNLSDLNSDVRIQLLSERGTINTEVQSLTGIISGSMDFVKKALPNIVKSNLYCDGMPIIASVHNGWRGYVRTLRSSADINGFAADVSSHDVHGSCDRTSGYAYNMSGYFASLMAVIEHVKLVLTLGKPLIGGLYFNLSAMEFDFPCNIADACRKLMDPAEDEKSSKSLADFRVLIIGCGGLGSPAAFALASSGLGSLGLVDFDTVDISNLNRQIMHTTSRVGMPKVKSAEIFLRELNPRVNLEMHNTRISKGNVQDIISSYDIIIGGLDNLPARYILNDACYTARKPLIEAGALDISGLVTTIIPDEGHCYRCIFPETEDNNSLPTCSETGVLGPVPGVMGVLQATEAVKLLAGTGESLKDRILLFDVFDTDIYVAAHGKNKYCDLCGNK